MSNLGKPCVLLFHGLSSSAAELRYITRGLNSAGYPVMVPVIPGYTYQSGPATSNRYWLTSVMGWYLKAVQDYGDVVVGGLCIGSLLALQLSKVEVPKAIIALSPTIKYDGWAVPATAPLLRVVKHIPKMHDLYVKETEPFGVKDPAVRGLIRSQMREAGTSQAGASRLRMGDILEAQALGSRVSKNLEFIASPTLIIHAKEDEISKPKNAIKLHNKIRGSKLVLLENSYHMITLDSERAKVLHEIKEFLNAKTTSTI